MDWAEDAARIFPEPPLPVYFIYIKLSAAYSAKRGWPTFTRGLRAASARRFCKISTSLMPSSCLSFDVARILPEPPRPEDCGVCEREGEGGRWGTHDDGRLLCCRRRKVNGRGRDRHGLRGMVLTSRTSSI